MTTRLRPEVHPSTGPATVLLTGFEAFGTDWARRPDHNPSWLAARLLHGQTIAGHRLVAARLPCAFGHALADLRTLLLTQRPPLVIAVGQAGGRPGLSLERIAINIDDARLPDNRGLQPVDVPVHAEGPAAYFSTLPIKAMCRDLQAAGFTAEVSQTAGTYVCNHVFYGLMHLLATEPTLRGCRGGFVHVPWLPQQGEPSLAVADTAQALHRLVATALQTDADVALSAGALH